MSNGAWGYRLIIDPLTRSLRREILNLTDPGARVLDIACGTGALVFEMASKAAHVTGIDLNGGKISQALDQARKLNLKNVRFLEADATHLETYFPEPFDLTVLSLAIHQFPEPLRTGILEQAMRISRQLILADYSVPRPKNASGFLSLVMENLAGGEHYRSYQTYLAAGGLPGITKRLDLKADLTATAGNGVFSVIRVKG